MSADFVWADEMASWYRPSRSRDPGSPLLNAWDNLLFAVREGGARILVTTTPRNATREG